jgi:hypothetical protein
MRMSVSSGNTYPLFDAQAGGLVSAGVREGEIRVSEAGLVRGRHSGLAADLLERLPLFEQATVDEILDIRRELAPPLIRFRKAITEFSATIKTAPWDEDFVSEAGTIFHRDVAPAVQEIEERVQSNRYLLLLLKRIGAPSASMLAAAMSRIADLPEIIAQTISNPAAAQAVTPAVASAVAATTGKAILDTRWEKYEQQRSIEQHQLYFYYRAKMRLS